MTQVDPFPAVAHDHRRCVDRALATADTVCAERGARLTDLRRRVLELIWRSHNPVSAYQLIELLGRERGAVTPPTVYRTLDFLVTQGLVHRIESLNAFVGCQAPAALHKACFLICRVCGRVAELDDPVVTRTLAQRIERTGFVADAERIEVVGTCSPCREAPAA